MSTLKATSTACAFDRVLMRWGDGGGKTIGGGGGKEVGQVVGGRWGRKDVGGGG